GQNRVGMRHRRSIFLRGSTVAMTRFVDIIEVHERELARWRSVGLGENGPVRNPSSEIFLEPSRIRADGASLEPGFPRPQKHRIEGYGHPVAVGANARRGWIEPTRLNDIVGNRVGGKVRAALEIGAFLT